jgi:hypothetical protein
MSALYDPHYAVKMLRQAIDHAEAEGDFIPVRKWAGEIENIMIELEKEAYRIDQIGYAKLMLKTLKPL